MGYIASLDIGAEKMAMAVAKRENGKSVLVGVNLAASQGMDRGRIADAVKVGDCVEKLFSEVVKGKEVEQLNVCLPAANLETETVKVSVSLHRKKPVELSDLDEAARQCRQTAARSGQEVMDIIPVAYALDNGVGVADPIGRHGNLLSVVYLVYRASSDLLADIRGLFAKRSVQRVSFFPPARAYNEALKPGPKDNLALVDIGAMGINVLQFRDGLLEYEAHLGLGIHAIDRDIMVAFCVNASQARRLKNEMGQALRCNCRNMRLPIPDTNLTLESRDLAMVIQCRAEELLEGVVYLLQEWNFDAPEDRICLTGGGSRLKDIDILLERMSGHQVTSFAVKDIQTSTPTVLGVPEYAVVLGLLNCEEMEEEEAGTGITRKIGGIFKDLFGIR